MARKRTDSATIKEVIEGDDIHVGGIKKITRTTRARQKVRPATPTDSLRRAKGEDVAHDCAPAEGVEEDYFPNRCAASELYGGVWRLRPCLRVLPDTLSFNDHAVQAFRLLSDMVFLPSMTTNGMEIRLRHICTATCVSKCHTHGLYALLVHGPERGIDYSARARLKVARDSVLNLISNCPILVGLTIPLRQHCDNRDLLVALPRDGIRTENQSDDDRLRYRGVVSPMERATLALNGTAC